MLTTLSITLIVKSVTELCDTFSLNILQNCLWYNLLYKTETTERNIQRGICEEIDAISLLQKQEVQNRQLTWSQVNLKHCQQF